MTSMIARMDFRFQNSIKPRPDPPRKEPVMDPRPAPVMEPVSRPEPQKVEQKKVNV